VPGIVESCSLATVNYKYTPPTKQEELFCCVPTASLSLFSLTGKNEKKIYIHIQCTVYGLPFIEAIVLK
jgi:hypothetical protein